MKHSLCRLLGAFICLGFSGQLAFAQKADLPAQTAKGKKAQPRKGETVSSNTIQITPDRLY